MRRAVILLGMVAFCACCSLGQSNGLPQWKVVKESHIAQGTSPLPPTALFTPPDNGLYRYSAYICVTSTDGQVQSVFAFADRAGSRQKFRAGAVAGGDENLGTVDGKIFSPKAGTPVVIEVDLLGGGPATYDATFVIEQLTH